jgi:putative transcriptional regulator
LNEVPTSGDLQGLDVLLASYAAGSLSPAMYALIAGHLELSPNNRPYVAALERMASADIARAAPLPIGGREAKLAAIFQEAAPVARRPCDEMVPRAIRHYIGCEFADVRWRKVLPGLKEFRVSKDDEDAAGLLWIRAGRRMPLHTHEANEVTLVLKGGFCDLTGHYGRGDIALADAAIDHQPKADEGEDCLCFVVSEGKLRLTGPVGRLVERLFGAGKR